MSLLLLVLSACRVAPPEEDVPPTPPPPSHALVWTAVRGGEGPAMDLSLRTRWVEVAPDGALTPRGEVDGLVYAAEDGLRRVLVARVERPGLTCEGAPGVLVERELRWGPVGSEATVIDPLGLGLDAEATVEDPYEWLDAVDVDGQIGPWLFVHGVAMDFGCGAHPNTHHAGRVVDLRSGEAFDVAREPSLREAIDALRAQLVAPFTAPGPDGTVLVEALGAQDLEFGRFVPRWTPEGLVVAAQIAAPTCYACGDGKWSSYTVSEVRDLPALPEVFQPWSVLPTWWPAVQPADGFSVAPDALRSELERAFAPPPVEAAPEGEAPAEAAPADAVPVEAPPSR